VVLERIKQTVKALTSKLNRYRNNMMRRKQNQIFSRNQHQFYRQLCSPAPPTTKLPPQEETLQFWRSLWSTPKFYNKEASWLVSQPHSSCTMDFQGIQCDDFKYALKQIPNWKSPGPDFIHGFWVKKLTSWVVLSSF